MSYTIRILAAVTFLSISVYAEDPWTPSPLCPFPSEDLTRFPYEGDCSKYWECYEGARYPMDCPTDLEFNDEKHRCDTPSLANCDPDATIIYPTFPHSTVTTVSTSPTDPTSDPGPVPDCSFPSDDIVYFPVVNNCSQYWECFQGNRWLMNCPPGQYWNQLVSYCDFPINVECKVSTVPTTPITTDTSTPTTVTAPPKASILNSICNNQPDGTYFPNPADCSKFYECNSGRATVVECPLGLVWNESILVCDYPINVSCENIRV